jgi:hypothetical protein
VIAVVFEAELTRAQAEELARLMEEGRPTRPEGVLTASLVLDGPVARLTAYWRDRETLDRYLSTTPVPRGQELMRRVGAEPTLRILELLELG